jgi:hypothetical protein
MRIPNNATGEQAAEILRQWLAERGIETDGAVPQAKDASRISVTSALKAAAQKATTDSSAVSQVQPNERVK